MTEWWLLLSGVLVRARVAVFSLFFVGGFSTGMWIVYIPSVKTEFGISNTDVGFLLLTMGMGSLVSILPTGRLIDRFDSKIVVAVGGVGLGLSMLGPAFASTTALLTVSLFVVGFMVGILDVAMNANGVRVEVGYRRPIFSAFHALWSVGGLCAALVGSLLLGAEIHRQTALMLTAVFAVTVTLSLWGWLLPKSFTTNDDAHSAAHSEPADPVTQQKTPARNSLAYVLFLGVMGAVLYMAEGASADWSPVFMRDIHEADASVAALAYAAFSATMTVGRLIADKIVARFGAAWTVRWGAVFAAFGVTIAVFSPVVWLAIVGWGLSGIGLAGTLPQIFKAAAVSGPAEYAGRNMSKVVGMGYAGMLVGPALIGFLAAFMPLSLALFTIVPMLIFTAVGVAKVRFH